jgi:hypothetical protein
MIADVGYPARPIVSGLYSTDIAQSFLTLPKLAWPLALPITREGALQR